MVSNCDEYRVNILAIEDFFVVAGRRDVGILYRFLRGHMARVVQIADRDTLGPRDA